MKWLKDLEKIITINSFTRNKAGVDAVGAVFKQWFKEIHFECTTHTRELIGNHLLFSSTKIAGSKILLLGHLDTVFPQGSFEHYHIDEKWVYGPGVCDMKGGNIVALEVLRNLFAKNGAIHNIDMLLVSDEETGSDDSKQLTASLASNYDYCFVFEAAGKKMEVVTGRKGIGTFEVHIEGKASHAGTNYTNGIDANQEAALKMLELSKLTHLQEGSTLNVGKIEGGIGANTISSKAKLLFEIRYTTNKERTRMLQAIDDIISQSYIKGTTSKLTGGIQRDVMEPSPLQEELLHTFETITQQTLLTEQRGGVSDANIVASQGVITFDGLGPFGDGDHTIHERAKRKTFTQRIELLTTLLQHHQIKGDFKS